MENKASSGDKGSESQFMKMLQNRPNDEDCERCLSQLGEYVAIQLAGGDYVALYPIVAEHLDACPDCADIYARLYELELAELNNDLPQVEYPPAPDLSFLTSTRQRDLTQRLKNALHRTAKGLRLQLTAELLPLLRPTLDTPITRETVDTKRYGEILFKLDPKSAPVVDDQLHLTVYRDAQYSETCGLEIVYEHAGQSWPNLGGRIITLHYSNTMSEETTDPWGWVFFEGVPEDALPKLIVEISDPDGK